MSFVQKASVRCRVGDIYIFSKLLEIWANNNTFLEFCHFISIETSLINDVHFRGDKTLIKLLKQRNRIREHLSSFSFLVLFVTFILGVVLSALNASKRDNLFGRQTFAAKSQFILLGTSRAGKTTNIFESWWSNSEIHPAILYFLRIPFVHVVALSIA